jgi:hypothetical protein
MSQCDRPSDSVALSDAATQSSAMARYFSERTLIFIIIVKAGQRPVNAGRHGRSINHQKFRDGALFAIDRKKLAARLSKR